MKTKSFDKIPNKETVVSMEENRNGSTKRKTFVISEQPATAPETSRESSRDNEKEIEEQMERFYALLDNIKAMRHAWGGGGSGSVRSKKMKVDGRTAAEVPWRPTFRLEDFMQGEDNRSKEKRVKDDADNGAERSDECRN